MRREKQKTFLEVLDEYLVVTAQEEKLAIGTQNIHKRYKEKIKQFFKKEKLTSLKCDEVRVRHMEALRQWLTAEVGAAHVRYISRHIEYCKRVTRYALLMEYSQIDLIAPIKNRRDKVKPVISLTNEELKRIIEFDFKPSILKKASSLFIFQCCTGLSYSDLWNFKVESENGINWICSQRMKTDRPYFVPMLMDAAKIYEKYNGELPRLANANYNDALKTIAKICNIKKRLHTHVGRKTYASLRDEEGFSTKTISEMLGNTQRVCEVHYLAKSTRRIENEFNRLGININATNPIQNQNTLCTPCTINF